jgi:hypothetical protein
MDRVRSTTEFEKIIRASSMGGFNDLRLSLGALCDKHMSVRQLRHSRPKSAAHASWRAYSAALCATVKQGARWNCQS